MSSHCELRDGCEVLHIMTTMHRVQLTTMATGSLDEVLTHFPPVSFAMAYGSGIFHQAGYSESDIASAMVDFVFAVDDPQQWHEANLAQNRHHYSAVGGLGGASVASIQVRLG